MPHDRRQCRFAGADKDAAFRMAGHICAALLDLCAQKRSETASVAVESGTSERRLKDGGLPSPFPRRIGKDGDNAGGQVLGRFKLRLSLRLHEIDAQTKDGS
ncbi:hypothetical protein HFO97_06545 [Rhizobium leguminosarum]|uniref:hypothetical protein n=1 Tax=Rhizobium leguminosarum TaxID=384 RepID=UPI001C93DF6A|nr:hypothetical protein [Rhizobium leguminosarum]MBY5359644.1 hypothetical protein [Rhizobium leguminosarum]